MTIRLYFSHLVLALGMAGEMPDVCDLTRKLKPAEDQEISSVKAKLVIWHGGSILTTSKDGQKSCPIWIEGTLPDPVLSYVAAHPREVMYSSILFNAQVTGKLERARSFRRSQNVPYPGNGFGRNGTYEYRITVTKWSNVEFVKKDN